MSTGNLGKTSKLVETEKKSYEKIMANIKNLSDEIQQFVKRFDGVKEEIDGSNKKFETYKIEIETKK
jgi:DNA replication initiation complex subunit (GINS family)